MFLIFLFFFQSLSESNVGGISINTTTNFSLVFNQNESQTFYLYTNVSADACLRIFDNFLLVNPLQIMYFFFDNQNRIKFFNQRTPKNPDYIFGELSFNNEEASLKLKSEFTLTNMIIRFAYPNINGFIVLENSSTLNFEVLLK